MQFTERAALITGGKRIGASVVLALAARGMDVAIVYNRSAHEAEETVAQAARSGRKAIALQANLADPEQCQRLVDDAAAQLGRLDVLINMASVYREVPLEETDVDVWNSVVNVDLRAAFLCARAALPHIRRGGTPGNEREQPSCRSRSRRLGGEPR